MSGSKDTAIIDLRRKTRLRRKKQDGVQNGRQMDPIGQYFAIGTSKFVY